MNYTCQWCEEHPEGADAPPVIKQMWAAEAERDRFQKELSEREIYHEEIKQAMDEHVKNLRVERDRAVRALKEASEIITNSCQILDVTKIEWGEAWSDWDQSVRDSASAWLKNFYSLSPVPVPAPKGENNGNS